MSILTLNLLIFSIGGDNCVIYEAIINMTGEYNEIFAHDLSESSFGFHIQVNTKDSDGNSIVTGMYPQNPIWSAPIIFSDAIIAGPSEIESNNGEWLIATGELKQNYPNPFNPVTKIDYELLVTTYKSASIVVYNVMG